MGESHFEKSCTAALREISTNLEAVLRTHAEAVPTPPVIARCLAPTQYDLHEFARTKLRTALVKALKVPAYPYITFTYTGEMKKHWPEEAQRVIEHSANSGLRLFRRNRIMEVLHPEGICRETANHLASAIISTPQKVREYTQK